MAKQILIVCEAIEAPAYSPRVVSMVRYLVEHGWNCHILTEAGAKDDFVSDVCVMHKMPHYKHLLADKLLNGREKSLFRFACKELANKKFDLVFCSTYYYFPLQTASLLAEKWNIPLVVDLRDIREQWGEKGFYTHTIPCKWLDRVVKQWFDSSNIKRRNAVLRKAAAVTTISPWHRDFLAQINPNCFCIYNGYNEEELEPKDVVTNHFRITYLGQIHSLEQRNPEVLFRALSSIAEQMPELEVDFYTGKAFREELYQMGERYRIPLHIKEFIPRQSIAERMQEASILLLLSSATGTHGIMPTKFFESMGVAKPLLSISEEKGCLAEAIYQTQVGISTTDVKQIQKFILTTYTKWKANGFTRQEVVDKSLYTRNNAAKQFEDLFNHSAHL